MADLVSLCPHNLSIVYNLARLGLDFEDVAFYFGLSKNKFEDVCKNNPDFIIAYNEGKSVIDRLNNKDHYYG